MKIVNLVGARPNFMKIAPLMREMQAHPQIAPLLVHTGQHYDIGMAGQFFQDLGTPTPNVSLEVGSGTHANQTAEVMKRLEPVLEKALPELWVGEDSLFRYAEALTRRASACAISNCIGRSCNRQHLAELTLEGGDSL